MSFVSGDMAIADLSKDQARQLQVLLNKKGFPCGEPDGIVGNNTRRAWGSFKQSQNLGQPVRIGPASLKTLESLPDKVNPSSINWNDPTQKISKYFTVQEVTQGDRRRIPTNQVHIQNILRMANELDQVREAWGKPIGVTSWYRPPAINAAVGGVSNSQHINGSGVDVYPIGGDVYAFQKWLDGRWDKALGYGAKKGFVHLDLRSGRARWNY